LFEAWSGDVFRISEPQVECVAKEVCKNDEKYGNPEACDYSAACGGLYFSVSDDLDQSFFEQTWQMVENHGIRYICMETAFQKTGTGETVYYGEDVEDRLRTLHFTANIVLYARRSRAELALYIRNLQNTMLLVNTPLFQYVVDHCRRSMVGDSQVCLGKDECCLELLAECIEFYTSLYLAFKSDKTLVSGLTTTVYSCVPENTLSELLKYTWDCVALQPATYNIEATTTSGKNCVEAHCNQDTLCTWLEQSILDFFSSLSTKCIESISGLDCFQGLVDQFDNMKKVILGGELTLGSGRFPKHT